MFSTLTSYLPRMITLKRKYYPYVTLSECTASHAGGLRPFKFFCLELPNRANVPNVSCIPEGKYFAVHRASARFKTHLHVLDVPGRSWILFHGGNTVADIRGCILPGDKISHRPGQQHAFIHNSRATLNVLLALYPRGYRIPVIIKS